MYPAESWVTWKSRFTLNSTHLKKNPSDFDVNVKHQNFRWHIPWWRLEISFYAANIRGENSLLLFILSKRLGWISANFPLRFESPRDLCCLQPWQHSVYQLCRCVWDHLRTLLLVVIVAKVSNYSIKKIKIFHKQGLHPAEILKREGLPVSFSSTTSIGKTSKAVYGSEQCVCGNSA